MKQSNNKNTSDIIVTIKYLSIYVSIICTISLMCALCGVNFNIH